MQEDDILDQKFTGFEKRIAGLRATNSEFDEICIDYVQMHREFERCRSASASEQKEQLADLLETLTGLYDEIIAFLNSEIDQNLKE